MYSVVLIEAEEAEYDEPLGTKTKFWFTRNEQRFLFKAVKRDAGEDWAERICSELCQLIGLPHVEYELALVPGAEGNTRGAVCESFVRAGQQLVLGNQLLQGIEPSYLEGRKTQRKGYTIDAVRRAVEQLEAPEPGWNASLPDGVVSALDCFIGYLVFDAWIANQDRHHENWGALMENRLYLAPTFDHGASLARNLGDDERAERLATRDAGRSVERFASRAKSAFFAGSDAIRVLQTLDAALQMSHSCLDAAKAWSRRIVELEAESVVEAIWQVPEDRMTIVAKEFTSRLLEANRRRIEEAML